MKPDKPLFLQCYESNGASIWINSGSTVKERIVKEFLRGKFGADINLNQMMFAGFWIIEGTIHSIEVNAEKYPSLSQYCTGREGSLGDRLEFYMEYVQEDELDIIRLAHDATRRHVLETMTEAPIEEKKSD